MVSKASGERRLSNIKQKVWLEICVKRAAHLALWKSTCKTHKAWAHSLEQHSSHNVVMHAFNPSTQGAQAGGSL